MTHRDHYPGSYFQTLEGVAERSRAAAFDQPTPEVAQLSERYGVSLRTLTGYETSVFHTVMDFEKMQASDELMQGVDIAKFGKATKETLPRFRMTHEGKLLRAPERSGLRRGKDVVGEVTTLAPAEDDVVWVTAEIEKGKLEQMITARAPEGASGYWIAGEPVNLICSVRADLLERDTHPYHDAFTRLDYWGQKDIKNTGVWNRRMYVMQPVQYFTSAEAILPEGVEGEIQSEINALLVDPNFTPTYEGSPVEAERDNEIAKLVLKAEKHGVDGLQFAGSIVGDNRRAVTIVKAGLERQDPEIVSFGASIVENLSPTYAKKHANLRYMVKLIAEFDPAKASSVAESITNPGVKACAIADIAKVAKDSRDELLAHAKEIVESVPSKNLSNAVANLFNQVIEFDKEFARSLLPLLPEAKRVKLEKELNAEANDDSSPGRAVGTNDIEFTDEEQRELTIAEGLLHEYRETGNHESLVKALAAGGLIKDIRRQQQLYNQIADQLTDHSLPQN